MAYRVQPSCKTTGQSGIGCQNIKTELSKLACLLLYFNLHFGKLRLRKGVTWVTSYSQKAVKTVEMRTQGEWLQPESCVPTSHSCSLPQSIIMQAYERIKWCLRNSSLLNLETGILSPIEKNWLISGSHGWMAELELEFKSLYSDSVLSSAHSHTSAESPWAGVSWKRSPSSRFSVYRPGVSPWRF